MLTYVYSSLFDSPAQTLVNTVNTVGVMGKGIAKVFRERYPPMYREYRKLCQEKHLDVGNLHLWKGDGRWVLNFPTKTTWRMPSQLEYIEKGLNTFIDKYEDMGIVSASFPPLGCGNGNLDWEDVRPLMEHYLSKINIPIYVHNVHVGSDFVPEHLETPILPSDFAGFWQDIRAVVKKNNGLFHTGEGQQPFSIQLEDYDIAISRGGKSREKIPGEEIQNAWVILRDGILSREKFPDETSRRYKSYLFPLLKSLPYVKGAPVSPAGQKILTKSEGLFLNRQIAESREAVATENKQGCLFL